MVSKLNAADPARYLKAEASRKANQGLAFLGSVMNPGYRFAA